MGLWDSLKRMLSGAASDRSAVTNVPPPEQGKTVDELARRLGMSVDDLRGFRPHYQHYSIPKRTGGARKIAAPDADTKSLQRLILRKLLARLRCHPAAKGFEPGESIATHALHHCGAAVVLRLDLVDFFDSTREGHIIQYFRGIGWNHDAASLLANLCTREGGLPQGAPTSPRLSNLVNFQMDARLAGLAAASTRRGRNSKPLAPLVAGLNPTIAYTRYADDLTFSFGADDHAAIERVIFFTQWIVDDAGYRLHTGKKLRIMRRHDCQTVTGLVVNERVRLPRHRRRWLRAVEHHMKTGKPATLTAQQIAGWKSLERMIEFQTNPSPG